MRLTEFQLLSRKHVFLLSYIDIFYKQCNVLDETTRAKYGYSPANEFLRVYPGLKMSFEHNSVCENQLEVHVFVRILDIFT